MVRCWVRYADISILSNSVSARLYFPFRAAGLYCSGMGKITRGRGGQPYKGLVIRLLVVFTLVQSSRSWSWSRPQYMDILIETLPSPTLPPPYKIQMQMKHSLVGALTGQKSWLAVILPSITAKLMNSQYFSPRQARLVANLSQRARSSKNIGVFYDLPPWSSASQLLGPSGFIQIISSQGFYFQQI